MGPSLSTRQSTDHGTRMVLTSAFVCAQLRATRHQRKYGFDSLSMRMETIGSCTRTAVMCGVVAIVCVWVASPSCTHEQRPWLMRAAIAVMAEYEIPKSAGSQLLLPALVEIGGAVGRVTAVSRTVLVRHFSNPLSFGMRTRGVFSPPFAVSRFRRFAGGGGRAAFVRGGAPPRRVGGGLQLRPRRGGAARARLDARLGRESVAVSQELAGFHPCELSHAYRRHRPKLSRS